MINLGELSDATVQHVQARAAERYQSRGDVDVVACPVCGWYDVLAYRHHTEAQRVITVVPLASQGRVCEKCTTAAQRAPELVQWVLGVVQTMAQRMAAK